MKRFFGLLAFLCLFASMPAAAQFNFGIKGGVNLSERPTLNIEEFKSNIKGSTGWYVGPTAKFIIPVVGLGFEANVLYSQTNIEIEGQNMQTQSIDVPLYLRYELSLPVVNNYIEPFIAVGPQFGWNIGEKSITLENIADLASCEYNIKDSNISLNFGLGFILFNHLQIHGNYNLALGKTADITGTVLNLRKEITEVKTNTWQVSLAYIF
jgi:hypothetical protein